MVDIEPRPGQPTDGHSTAPAQSPLPPLYLHIGRGKSGSSTIQSLAHEHVQFMKSIGFTCPTTVHGMVNHARLAAALHAPHEDPETIQKFRLDVRRNKKRKLFISGEILFSLNRDSIQRLKRHAGPREIRILCYVRDYPSWLQSMYAQRTKTGSNIGDFDAYYRTSRRGVSALPRIDRWAEAFGWESMHVRPLLPEALVGGSLMTDVLSVLGAETCPDGIETHNVAPHWVTLELLRALAATAKASPIGILDQRSVKVARAFFELCSTDVKPRRAQYLTREQWLDLAELYRSDMNVLGRHQNMSFAVPPEEPPERPFLPDISVVPDTTKAQMLAKLDEPRVRSRFQAPVLEMLVRILTAKSNGPAEQS